MAENITIADKIKNGTYTINNKQKTRSKVWEFFGEILDETGTKINNKVACKICKMDLNIKNNSTTNLLRHKCYLKSRPSEENIIKVESADRKKLLNAALNMVVKDVKPFCLVEGDGMIEFAKCCVEIGSKYGAYVDVADMLPCSSTVRNNLENLYNKIVPSIKNELVVLDHIAATTDIWTDPHKKIAYLSLTVQYISNDEMIERILAIQEMEEAHTGENIYEQLVDIFSSYGIHNLNKISFVTDRGANIKRALRNNIRYSCIDHLLHNILLQAVDSIPELSLFFQLCKNLVRYFKKSNIMSQLQTTLKSDCITRWTSKYSMCVSIHENMQDIFNILVQKGESSRLRNINSDLLLEIINLLKHFNDAVLELQYSKKCTVHLVFPYYYSLKRKCVSDSNDSEIIKQFKVKLSEHLTSILLPEITIFHKAAAFLYPPFKKMPLLTENERTEIYEYIKNIVGDENFAVDGENNTDAVTVDGFDDERFVEFLEPADIALNPIDNQLQKYIELKLLTPTIKIDVMSWWAQHKDLFRALYKAHTLIHSVPATSAASERAFSAAGHLLMGKRNRMCPETVNQLIVTNSFTKYNRIEYD